MYQSANAASRYPDFQSTAFDSVSHVKVLLLKLFERLELKGKKFEGFNPASSSEIDELWAQLQDIDSTTSPNVSMTKVAVKKTPDLKKVPSTLLCTATLLLCGKEVWLHCCTICNPPRLPQEVFSTLHSLPDPVLGEDGHYNPSVTFWAPKQMSLTNHLFKRRHRDVRPFLLQQASNMLT